jgi:hypothetical protein
VDGDSIRVRLAYRLLTGVNAFAFRRPVTSLVLPVRCRAASNYARRRKRAVRTRSRNCSGVSVGGVGADFGFTTAAAVASAAFFAALRAASCASFLVAKSFAAASIISAGEPSRPIRWPWEHMGGRGGRSAATGKPWQAVDRPQDLLQASHDDSCRHESPVTGRPQRNAVGGDPGRIMDPHGRRRRQSGNPAAAKRGASERSGGSN